MRIVDYNKTLTEALEYSKPLYQFLEDEETPNFDDEELAQFSKIHNLSQLQKDILYLYSQTNNVSEIARLYKVSTFFIRRELTKIKQILQ